jgi:hypothetical protein
MAMATLVGLALFAVTVPDAAAVDPRLGEPILPDGLEIRFGDDVSASTRGLVTEAVERSWDAFFRRLPDAAEFDAVVVVVTNADDAAREWATERGISVERARRQFTARTSAFAGLATSGLTVIINDNTGSPGATVHEMIHLFQHHVAGDRIGARWISEGAAEYYAGVIEEDWGLFAGSQVPEATIEDLAEQWASTIDTCSLGLIVAASETCVWASEPLPELESGAAFDVGGGAVSPYARATVAFDYLVSRVGDDGYICYLDHQSTGAPWRNAFDECFTFGVDEFYDDFHSYRANAFTYVVRERRFQPL